ncbi:CBS domain-containing protein [Noviherbaspirillum massiliense]|uniref:CBS domain-containing protein n=1 Tax=Noviherbaspirillum massiliense TaxID=1465823 RepID=UPI0011DD065A|nr:CBS domain-containing protein [Noviherbaspirillum massiliense]
MQMVSQVMTRDVRFVSPQESLQRAAQMMDEMNVGALPVCDGDRLVGMVTDRDITIRGVAAGRTPGDAHVDEVMSTDVRCVFEDQPFEDVMIQMADSQIRRVPVVSHDEQRKLVGIVSLGDVVTKGPAGQRQEAEEMVEMVSSPSEPGHPMGNVTKAAGRTAEVGADAGRRGSQSEQPAGTDVPRAGQSGIGAAGASGDPGTNATGGAHGDAATGDPRRNYGVGGQDITGGGLPPTGRRG